MNIHTTLTVGIKGKSYPIYIGSNLSKEIQSTINELKDSNRKVAIITDENISKHYPDWLNELFQDYPILSLPAGETTKSIEQLSSIYDFLCENSIDRKSVLFAVGGGVIGDITGFAAASYMRGISFYQIPTTLLAMVDSSVGGKTGINIKGGKNLVGAFHQPDAVFIDTQLLETLPSREFSAGMAEVIKTGLLGDKELYEKLVQLESPLDPHHEELSDVIASCCILKSKVVEADEKELAKSGGRALLNLGHTFGHAIEAVCGYGHYLHGEAVSIGLNAAYLLSKKLEYPVSSLDHSLLKLLEDYKLPTRLSDTVSKTDLIQSMYKDKKTLAGKLRFVVLQDIGDAITQENINEDYIIDVWSLVGAV